MPALPSSVAELKKVAEGREAEMFDWDDGRLLRLSRSPHHARSMQLHIAGSRAAAAGGVRVPAFYESVEIDGRPGMVVERIEGMDLLTEIAAKPWRVWNIGTECGRLQSELNSVTVNQELPEVRAALANQIRRTDRIPERYADFALRELEALPEGDRLCHGDFHPANVLRAPDGLVVIDWPNAMRGDVHSDFARSMVILRLGDPPPGAPWLIRNGAKFARALLKSSYERAYRKAIKLDETLYDRWETVRAIHRLGDGIDSEREKILRLLKERLGGE